MLHCLMGKDAEGNCLGLWSCRCTIPALPGRSWLNQESLSRMNGFLLWFKFGTSQKFSKTANLSTETPLSAPAAGVSCDGVVELCLPSGRACVFWSDFSVMFSTVCRRNRPAGYVCTQWEKTAAVRCCITSAVRCCITAPMLDNLDEPEQLVGSLSSWKMFQ
jgi:hypothetical protein